MNRLSFALRVLLLGVPEPVIREVPVEVVSGAEEVTLYRVCIDSYCTRLLSEGWHELWRSVHLSCEAAFAAIPETDRAYTSVESLKAIRIGNRYFKTDGEQKVSKPKRAKGKSLGRES